MKSTELSAIASTVETGGLPAVSCGIFVKNEVQHLKRCIDSLLAQNYPPIEICISDNASTDGSVEVLRKFAAVNDCIRLNLNADDVGQAVNARKVLEMASGEYFFFVGADDYYDPNFVVSLVTKLNSNLNAKLAMCNSVIVDEKYRHVGCRNYAKIFKTHSPAEISEQIISIKPTLKEKKLNMAVLGIFRRDFLIEAIRVDPDVLTFGDRFLPFVASLHSELIFVDKTLFIKTKKDRIQTSPITRPKQIVEAKAFKKRNVVYRWLFFLFRHKELSLRGRLFGFRITIPHVLYVSIFRPLNAAIGSFFPVSFKLCLKKVFGIE